MRPGRFTPSTVPPVETSRMPNESTMTPTIKLSIRISRAGPVSGLNSYSTSIDDVRRSDAFTLRTIHRSVRSAPLPSRPDSTIRASVR